MTLTIREINRFVYLTDKLVAGNPDDVSYSMWKTIMFKNLAIMLNFEYYKYSENSIRKVLSIRIYEKTNSDIIYFRGEYIKDKTDINDIKQTIKDNAHD